MLGQAISPTPRLHKGNSLGALPHPTHTTDDSRGTAGRSFPPQRTCPLANQSTGALRRRLCGRSPPASPPRPPLQIGFPAGLLLQGNRTGVREHRTVHGSQILSDVQQLDLEQQSPCSWRPRCLCSCFQSNIPLWSPSGSTPIPGEFPTYRYKFGSPAANPIGSSDSQRLTFGSYHRFRFHCKPLSSSKNRPV